MKGKINHWREEREIENVRINNTEYIYMLQEKQDLNNYT